MRVIICGAEALGAGIAKHLSDEEIDVVVIDPRQELLGRISDSMDVQTILGEPSNPGILEKAGAKNAQIIIGATVSDETNILACQTAHFLFGLPYKIAYIQELSYFKKEWRTLFSPLNIPIDVLLCPALEVAKTIFRTIEIPGAFTIIPRIDERIRVVGVHCYESSPLLRTPLRLVNSLFPSLSMSIMAVIRDGELILPDGHTELQSGDDAYFISKKEEVESVMTAFGYQATPARSIVIFGAGNIGMILAKDLEAAYENLNIKMIELDRNCAYEAARHLERGMVLCGDVLDLDVLKEANINQADLVVAVTNDSEINILASLLVKKNGARKVLTLINNPAYSTLISPLGIDAVISPRDITISSVLHYVKSGKIRSIHTMGQGLGEFIEGEISEASPFAHQSIKAINNPKKFLVGSVIREGEILIGDETLILQPHDAIVLCVKSDYIKEAEALFTQDHRYF